MSNEIESPLDDEFSQISIELWENNAKWWQDGFTQGVDPEYEEQIIPLLVSRLSRSRRVLDVGTGEGQLARIISNQSEIDFVVGIDPTWEQIEEAFKRAPYLSFLKSSATQLPFSDSSFDTAVACLVFEHIEDLEGAIKEISRLLTPNGRFLFFLNHPLMQTPGSGWIDDQIIGEQYWRIGKYLEQQKTVEEVEKDIFIPFIHRPLSTYLNTLAENNLFLVHIDEPSPPAGFLDRAPEYYEAASVPRLLFLELIKMVEERD